MKQFSFKKLIAPLVCVCMSLPASAEAFYDSNQFHSIPGSNGKGWSSQKILNFDSRSVSGVKIYKVAIKDNQCQEGFREHIEFDGAIDANSFYMLNHFLGSINKCKEVKTGKYASPVVYLNSPGGQMVSGYKMGVSLRKYSATTYIASGQRCSSSCAIAYLGGSRRIMENGGSILFHAPYIEVSNDQIQCSKKSTTHPLYFYFRMMTGTKDGNRIFNDSFDNCSKSGGWEVSSVRAKSFGITQHKYTPNRFHSEKDGYEFALAIWASIKDKKSNISQDDIEYLELSQRIWSGLMSSSQYKHEAYDYSSRIEFQLGRATMKTVNNMLWSASKYIYGNASQRDPDKGLSLYMFLANRGSAKAIAKLEKLSNSTQVSSMVQTVARDWRALCEESDCSQQLTFSVKNQ